ncbi:MAG: Crossover junction endodeoxyribonuclease RuvC [Chlamydiales bacterium]|nr:Crossover junction endodeoxyribonuclease RuvC [Chlamydiales bacterium]
MKRTKIILGIDPGTSVTGFGLIQVEGARRFTAVDYGCIRPPASQPLSQRYRIIFEGVENLVKKYQPDAVAVETQYIHKNPQSGIKLGMARGVVVLAAALREIPLFEYAPARAKMAVVGTGRASKQQVQAMVQRLLTLSKLPEPEDAADALAIAICHGQTNGSEKYLI